MKKQNLNYIWHPCSQMKDYTNLKPLRIKSASGSYIELENGKRVIDAISSWWCKLLGHGHPYIKAKVIEQINKFEHVMLANTINEKIIELSEKLASETKNLNKIFYAGDGSCAVEIALKMSLHSRKIKAQKHKNKFIAFENGYHGETMGALSVSDLGIYKNSYKDLLFDVYMISNIPYINSKENPLWDDCSIQWKLIEEKLEKIKNDVTAIIFEPIVQGAGGMKIYSKDLLVKLKSWAIINDIHLIADEIMTGICRTGKMFACEYANIEPDFLCLSKGLTSGWLPFSAVMIKEEIYDLFYNDYSPENSFLHSHTYCGNPIGVSAALATLEIIENENILSQTKELEIKMLNLINNIAIKTGRLKNVRGIGGIVAADLIIDDNDKNKRIGFEIFKRAVHAGALLRPLGNTIYWLPPVNIKEHTLEELSQITEYAITSCFK
ncbi:adenosylmethionine--8-amino-7-oxononanoate transaminase [Candidatus Bandiella numerosa]|uniref:adenosylmethionine--8-amino-7-oxononanoate transaminase n=1 Tax=Candidatus Bandiella numerosa TaxID=2570586 RepID=UPI00249E0643|nr:adenosylmethionine--8-amino-7-oxononanoate transaminase [Candidatus Bandiella numerosa]WHA05361.1 adenosylmethionine--8-amino-7-oxononanoate transaminase [Candidatus Bandiella numerosa]